MKDDQAQPETTTDDRPKWQLVEDHLRSLAFLMLPPEKTTAQFLKFLEAGEYGLALDELAAEVNGHE